MCAALALTALASCSSAPGSTQEEFPRLSDIPETGRDVLSPEERRELIENLEKARDTGTPLAPTGGNPAVPPGAPKGKAAPANDPAKDPQAQLGRLPIWAALRTGRRAGGPPAAQSVPALRGSQGADGASRPLVASGITGATNARLKSALALDFDGHSAQLRGPDRERTINAALSHLARGGTGATIITGGGAEAGGLLPDFTLGLERASTVADLLVHVGLKAANIKVTVAGDPRSNLLVDAPYMELAEHGAVLILY